MRAKSSAPVLAIGADIILPLCHALGYYVLRCRRGACATARSLHPAQTSAASDRIALCTESFFSGPGSGERPDKRTCAMTDAIRELKIRAEILHKKIGPAHSRRECLNA